MKKVREKERQRKGTDIDRVGKDRKLDKQRERERERERGEESWVIGAFSTH